MNETLQYRIVLSEMGIKLCSDDGSSLNYNEARELIDELDRAYPKPSIVYVLRNPQSGFYKIGYTSNPINKRVSQIQSREQINNLDVINIYERHNAAEARELESYLHNHYQDNHVYGEWFDLDSFDIAVLKQMQIKADDWYYLIHLSAAFDVIHTLELTIEDRLQLISYCEEQIEYHQREIEKLSHDRT